MARKRDIDRRIAKVLRHLLDAEPDAERIAEYRELAVEQYGSVEAMLKLDERDMHDECEP